MDEREVLTWDLFGKASRELAELVAADGFRPDLILSIARGGLFTAGALGYALGVKNVHVMNVEFYTGSRIVVFQSSAPAVGMTRNGVMSRVRTKPRPGNVRSSRIANRVPSTI